MYTIWILETTVHFYSYMRCRHLHVGDAIKALQIPPQRTRDADRESLVSCGRVYLSARSAVVHCAITAVKGSLHVYLQRANT